MRKMKKFISLIAAAAMVVTSVPISALDVHAEEAQTVAVDSTVRLKPSEASTFNDTNSDGLGEFQGWGTSLCWWANRIGYSEKLTNEAAKLFFSEDGLNMNIGRYNVGGGDDIGDTTSEEVKVNEKASFYDLTEGTYTYAGTSGKVETYSKMAGMTYSASDADFGITKGTAVGKFSKLGWINKLGDTPGSGDNLQYKVNANEAGNYTVKLLLTLEGTNTRDVAIRVNAGTDSQADYVADADTINNSIIAEGNNNSSHCMLFCVTLSDVALNAGENTINIAGQADWTLDFVKMAVIKSGEEGVLPETDPFKHAAHIIRSDSGVPGYAVDVTKIDESKHDLTWYTENFDRADAECGYAWNYDWDADKNQMNVLKAAAKASGEDFLAEAFSNSPPYFMTVSGCSSGNTNSNTDNLRADSYHAFAAYMADVIEHWNKEGVITFQSTDPMNEPATNYWGANSNKQEGCHFSQGESQSKILVALNEELKNKGINIIISGTDETNSGYNGGQGGQIDSYNKLSDEAKAVLGRIDTHTYTRSSLSDLSALAQSEGKNLWMSEVDGSYTAGTKAGEMSAALGLAGAMMTEVNGLKCSAWILWNAIDMHADSSEYGQSWVNKGSANDFLSMEALEKSWKSTTSNGYWGLAAANHDDETIAVSMKYYAYGQLSRYIRPGYTIIGTNKTGTTLAAYDKAGKKVVVVASNTSDSDKTWKFDLSRFETMGSKITAIRTSGTLADGEHWADVTDSDNIAVDAQNMYFTATMKANSITTYTIEGVDGIKKVPEVQPIDVEQIIVNKDQVTSSAAWNNGTTNVGTNVVDNNFSTFFDGVANGYVTLDLKTEMPIAAVSYAPRAGYESRCEEAVIYGSADGKNWTELYTIESTPAANKDTMVYYSEFNTYKEGAEPVSYRYIKYAVDANGSCNLSELKVYKPASDYTVEPVSGLAYPDGTLSLPKTLTLTEKGGEAAKEANVTWNTEGVDFGVTPYTYLNLTGTVEGYSDVQANATVQVVPKYIEYMIDCNNNDSQTFKNLQAAGIKSMVNTVADQKKTDDNTWGYLGSYNAYNSENTSDSYAAAWYQASVQYTVTLPAGTHTIMVGSNELWAQWNATRQSAVYYTVDGEEQKLADLNLTGAKGVASGEITLDEEKEVTITVKKVTGNEAIVNWITVCGKSGGKKFSDAEIAANNYVLYLANAGTSDVTSVPADSNMGLYQGSLDQAYAEDSDTGYSWGYVEDAAYTATARGGDTTLKGSYRYQSDKITYEAGKSGIDYRFELPEGNYEVTVGIDNPWHQWGTKTEDILLEGEKVESGLTAKDFEGTYKVTVTDGELNVFVQATSRSKAGDDPIVNYIIVKAIPGSEADALAVLKVTVQKYLEKVAGKDYTTTTKAAFDQAIADAQKLIDENSADTDAIAAAKKAIEKAYSSLVEAHFETYDSITGTNAARIYDNNGAKVQAHGGQIQKIGDTYYWIGEDRTNGYRPMPGVHMYSSKDLYNWKDEGVVLRTMDNYDQFETDNYFKNLYGDLSADEKKDIYADLWAEGCVMERPKMLYNEKTGKYVIWFHADGTSPYSDDSTSNYAKAKAGIAISDSINGPYKLVGSYMLANDYGDHGFDSVGGHVRDMNLFQDDDGTAYVMYSSEGNAVMYIAKLNDTYTGLAKDADEMVLGEDFCISSTDSREAPAMFKYQGKYYLITSGCTGWAPNQARYAVADSPLGPWTNMGNPCVGDTANNTFETQSTCVIPVDAENGKFIYMGDRWYNPDNGKDLSDSRYVWLPIEFGANNTIAIKNYKDWTLDELEDKGAISINTALPETVENMTALKAALPKTIDVTIGTKVVKDAKVTWTVDESAGETALGYVTVTGTLKDLNREFTIQVFCCPKSLVYFADCYTNGDNTSSIYEKFAATATDLKNMVSDQAYGDDNGVTWGYTSTPGASGGSSSQDMGSKGSGDFFDTGWWATSGGKIEYGFELTPGTYTVATGFHEWWSSSRGIKITVSSVDADGKKTELGTGSASLSSGKTEDRSSVDVTVPEGSDHILVTISKASGSDPVLSWIGIISNDVQSGELDWTDFDAVIAEKDQLNEADWTADSWSAFQAVVKEAKDFKANATNETKQRDIREMIAKVNAAEGKLISIHEPTGDVTYYVDAVNGDDANDGTTPETAWKTLTKASSIRQLKAGGSILLKAGCVWNGEQLFIDNAIGSADAPIVIGSYGEGAKPVINGNGADWSASTKEDLAAVHIRNSQNIVIENLEITNWDLSAGKIGSYKQSSKLLSGLVVENRDGGELTNVTIRNNKIHDVNGKMAGGVDKGAGGLIVLVTGNGSNHTGTVESYYTGLAIEGNEVYNVCHEAIYMESVWASRKLVGGTSSDTGYQNAGNSKWIGSSNVTISNNYVHDVAGDGIVPINTTDAMVEYNLVDNSADSSWNYSANQNHAAIWSWDSNNVTFRYNEASNTSRHSVGSAVGNDSMAFDFDYGVQNCVYEYNYSHDNLGGFLMLCPGPGATVNNIARYNVSVNDGKYDGAPVIRMGTGKYGSLGVQIYNNTIYWENNGGYTMSLTPDSYWEGPNIKEVSVFNNIFYGPAKADSMSTKEGITYSNNLVYSSDGSAEAVYEALANDAHAVYADPQFADVTDYTAGSWADGKTTLGTAEGFRIAKTSPAADAGMAIPEAPSYTDDTLGGELAANKAEIPSVDYYGNALTDGTPDIGANETVKKADEDAKPADGLGMDKDGNWFYYKDGKVDTAYTGLAANEYGWWYVEAGQINFNVTGLVNDSTYGWWYVENSQINFNYTGLVQNAYGWWYVENGAINFNATGLARNEYGWWYVENGQVNFNYTGLAANEYGWWYVEGGKINFNYTGLVANEYGWWYVEGGKINFNYTGLAANEYGWWRVEGGKINFNYTGLALNEYGWWYVEGGKINFNYNGYAAYYGVTYRVEGGKVITA